MPRLVQWSRFSDAFQKLFGIQGATQLNVIDDVFMTLPVEQELLHLAYLRGWKPWAVWSQPGAVVGQVGNAGVVPAANTLCVVEGFEIRAAAASAWRVGFPTVPRAAGTQVPGRDSRLVPLTIPNRVPGVSVNAGNNAVAQVATVALQVAAGVFDIPFVVAPGNELIIENTTVNQAFDVNFWGMYREITDQEK